MIDWEEHTGGHHGESTDCEFELFYQGIISIEMPLLMDIFRLEKTNCNQNNYTVESRYIKQLCTLFCVEEVNGYFRITNVDCGESSACCTETTRWCIDRFGEIQTTYISNVQDGECNPGNAESSSCNQFIDERNECSPRASGSRFN